MTEHEKRKIAIEYIGELMAQKFLAELEAGASVSVHKDGAYQSAPNPDGLLSESDVLAVAGVSQYRTLAGWIESSYFPAPATKIGRVRHWEAADVYRWQRFRDSKHCRGNFSRWLDSKDDMCFDEFE